MKKLNPYWEIADLLSKYNTGEITPEELDRLNEWIHESDENKKLWERINDPAYVDSGLKFWEEDNLEEHWDRLKEAIENNSVRKRSNLLRISKYAAILIVLFSMIWFGADHVKDWKDGILGNNKLTRDDSQSEKDILPRGKVAQLFLGDGETINLDVNHNESFLHYGTRIHNNEKMLKYSIEGNDNSSAYDSLVVPKGAEYKVTLSDGTNVWLNSNSSLRYPVKFEKGERLVTLTGEGYFEVTKDPKAPFIVSIGDTKIKVLGTKFNVSSYEDDSMKKVSLIEGQVEVSQQKSPTQDERVLLSPGFGAVIKKEINKVNVQKINTEAVVSWKDEMFVFDREPLADIMKKISRWYNMEVWYEQNVLNSTFHFTGRMKRYEALSKTLGIIEQTQKISFRVEGNIIRVYKAGSL